MSHHAQVYTTLEAYVTSTAGKKAEAWNPEHWPMQVRHAHRKWKLHVEKRGNTPLVTKCPLCSGKEHKHDVKAGRYRSIKDRLERFEKREVQKEIHRS